MTTGNHAHTALNKVILDPSTDPLVSETLVLAEGDIYAAALLLESQGVKPAAHPDILFALMTHLSDMRSYIESKRDT